MPTTRHFGEVPGCPEGTPFASRRALSQAGVHRPTQAGISGSELEGADSIVLSGGYEDDEDNGVEIIYTGQGGNDPNTGRQVADQTLTRGNKALALSRVRGMPVRVIRGSGHLSSNSPSQGYRYDGLYLVEDCWNEVGRSGYRIWRFRMSKMVGVFNPSGTLPPRDDGPARRSTSTVSRIIRDTQQARLIKELYNYECQICGVRLVGLSGPYAESAHIRPLGRPHNGPDTPDNILCLCPNHHVLLDHGGIFIEDDLSIFGESRALNIHPTHTISSEHLRYHREHYQVG
jgi:putative restriction endonuclease